MFRWLLLPTILILLASGRGRDTPFGIAERPAARPFLGLPDEEGGSPPALLSQTGVFEDVRALTPSAALIPYDLIAPFWSDGAEKRRWIAVPNDGSRTPATIRVAPDGEWLFPEGTVLVKHFEIATDVVHGSTVTPWVYHTAGAKATNFTWKTKAKSTNRVKVRVLTSAGYGTWMKIHRFTTP